MGRINMYWALIKDNTVKNIIVAEQPFIDFISDKWDDLVHLPDGDSRPNIGDTYEDGVFTPAQDDQE